MIARDEKAEARSPASAYLEEQGALFRSGGFWDCLAAARGIAALLMAEGRSPWIARLRKREERGGEVFHAPLIARSARGVAAWTTHYVCCCEGEAYDPLAGGRVKLESYSTEVFGERIALEIFVPPDGLADYLERASTRKQS